MRHPVLRRMVGAAPVALFAGLAWWPAGMALGRVTGMGDAAAPLAMVAAVLLAVGVARGIVADGAQREADAGRCPRCGAILRHEHLHARAGARADGLLDRSCAACDWRDVVALTCAECAA